MTAYHLLPPAVVLMSVGSLLSYSEWANGKWWFPWSIVLIGVVNCLLWSASARWTPDRRELYSVSVAWDVATIAAYSVLPLVASGVRLSPSAWAGFGLVLLGTVLVKRG